MSGATAFNKKKKGILRYTCSSFSLHFDYLMLIDDIIVFWIERNGNSEETNALRVR
jgi:hypothetical protein